MAAKVYKALIFAAACILGSCDKQDPGPSSPPVTGERKVFVVCEGSLGNGNGQMDMYLPESDSVFENVYYAANGHSLGDVFQSMDRISGSYYLCVNNSDKVAVIGRGDLKLHLNVNIPKPRYLLQTGPDKIYVSSLFHNQIYVIDTSGTQNGTIGFKGKNPEGMLAFQDKVFVATWDTALNYIYVVDKVTDQLVDSHTVAGYAPQELLLDSENKLWVLSGNMTKGKTAVLTRMDPLTGSVITSYTFPSAADVVRPVLNNARDTIYFIEVNQSGGTTHNGIYRMGIHDQQLPQQPFIPAQQFQYFWALAVDPVTGYIYVGDPRGFIQKGTVLIYRQDGSLLSQFKCGAGPGHFFFDQ